MAAVFLDSITTEYYNGSAWVDITQYVVGDIKGGNGLGGWRPENRVGVLGTMNITINNKSKQFSPMGGDSARGLSTMTGWNKGAKIRVVGVFDRSLSYVIWTGRIASIDSDDLNWGNEHVRVTAVDWMNVPGNYPMSGATIGTNKRIDQAMTTLVARLSLQPESKDFDTGNFIFPAVFDNVQRKTMALSEFTKLANSELGYIYVNQDGTLRVENMLARNGWRALDQVWATPDTAYLLMEDGNFLLLEDGGKIILDEGAYEDADISADLEGHNILLADDGLLNASIIRAHPVITDTTLKVLYKLGTPLFIPAGQTATFSAHYTDPNGFGQISATAMEDPVATTDYLANTRSNGSGTNKTSDQVVTATYYGDIVNYSILNNADVGIYITFLQARGYGIYYGNSVESIKEDTTSQSAYGYAPFQFDMKYQKDTRLADMFGLSVLEEYKTPKSRITEMKYLANLNKNHMMCFLMLTVGSLILGTEDRSNISSHYYITDRAFTIKQGGLITVEYGVKQNDSYLSGGLVPLTIEFAGGSATDAINYGKLPQISNLSQRTISMWLYLDTDPTEPNYYWLASWGNCYRIFVRPSQFFQVSRKQAGLTTGAGNWTSPAYSLNVGAWNHIVIKHDMSVSTTANPLMYVNGASVSVTVVNAAVGAEESESGENFIIGNRYSATENYDRPLDGKIFDMRVYSRILTAAEVTTLYNAGSPDETLVTDGLAFQGMATFADLTHSAGTVVTTNKLTENVIRAVGIPNGSPTIRANP